MMYKHHPYNDPIESKLGQLAGADTDHLWTGMKAILDRKMPEKKEKRRLLGWFLTTRGLCFSSVSLLALLGTATYIHQNNNQSLSHSSLTASDNTHQKEQQITSEANTASAQPVTNALQDEIAGKSQLQDISNSGNNFISGQASSATYQGKRNQVVFATQKNNLANTPDDLINSNNSLTQATAQDNTFTGNIAGSHTMVRHLGLGRMLNNNQGNIALTAEERKPVIGTLPKRPGLFQEKGFYAGIVAGIDLSSIKFEKMKTGHTKGILAGYAFNNKWSIETGLNWDQKRYYSDGEYYKTPLPTGVTMLAVNGDCSMYEWPVNLKYTVLTGRNSLFATTGLSSYYMKRENYNYEYEQNGQYSKQFVSYSNESTNLFSVVNFSVGYQHQFGNLGRLRVEPYLRLPIKDLGINNMPIMSTGLNIGFTRFLSR